MTSAHRQVLRAFAEKLPANCSVGLSIYADQVDFARRMLSRHSRGLAFEAVREKFNVSITVAAEILEMAEDQMCPAFGGGL